MDSSKYGGALWLQSIGDNNLIMGSCHIAHDCKLGNHNILANATLLGGHVILKVCHIETLTNSL